MRWKEYPIGDSVSKCQIWNPKSSGTGRFGYIDLSSVDKNTKSIASIERHECSDAPSRARQLVETDDVLVATVRPNLNGVALVNGAHHGMTASTGYCVLRPNKDKLDSRFLFHWVKTGVFVQRMVNVATGANYPAVSDAKVKASKIPLPPLPEQKRIAGILDAADALRAKRREALAQLDFLIQSIFLDMFGDPVTNPMGWTKVRSGELFLLPPKIGTTTPAAGRGYLVVRVGEVGEFRIVFERCGRVEISEQDFAKFRLERGDTVIARAIGSKNHLGKASFFADFDEATVIDSHVMRLRPDPIKCDGLWFYSLISSDRGKVLLQQAGGATAVQFNINAKQASSVPVALPPLDLQHRFAAIVESVERQKASQRAHLAELDTLFASLQSRAFRGDL